MIIITKWTCAKNHLATCVAWDDGTCSAKEVELLGRTLLLEERICDLCHRELTPVHIDSPYDSLPKAQAYILGLQIADRMKTDALRRYIYHARN